MTAVLFSIDVLSVIVDCTAEKVDNCQLQKVSKANKIFIVSKITKASNVTKVAKDEQISKVTKVSNITGVSYFARVSRDPKAAKVHRSDDHT